MLMTLCGSIKSADINGWHSSSDENNEDAIKKVGRTIRDTVLSLGRGEPTTKAFKEFRGR